MLAELVKTVTADGLRLDGALHSSTSESGPRVDSAICLHGVGSNFYGAALFDSLARTLVAQGVDVLRANTRGRDGFFHAAVGGTRRSFGAAYEVVDECRLDIRAWIEFLRNRGRERIALIGHSLGAIKAVYAQAFEPRDEVAAVLALSPPQLSHQAFQFGPSSGVFGESMATAQSMVAEGRGEELFLARFPFPLLIAAEAYVDKYGPGERYNILKFIQRIPCPTLFTYGQLELESGGVAFAGLPGAISAIEDKAAEVDVQEIADADHLYNGVFDQLGETVVGWLQSRFA